MFRKKLSEEDIKILEKELNLLDKLESLYNSQHGKFLVEILSETIETTTNEEDGKNIYEMDMNARDIFFISARAKRQTLKALKRKLETAAEEKAMRAREIASLK